MTTLAQVRDKADQKLADLWVNVIRPKELEWFAVNREYAQCIHTQNIPDNQPADATVRELLPETNLEPSDRPGVTAKSIFGSANIDVSLPFALAIDAYRGPYGPGFVGRVWVKYEGVTYMRAKNYGPETHNAFNWVALP
jgi:hypothetical protein